MPISFDTDSLGAVLWFGVLHGAKPPDHKARADWEAQNLRKHPGSFQPPPMPWIGPAITRAQLEDLLAEGRSRDDVRRRLARIFATCERYDLLDIFASDGNEHSLYREVNALGRELVLADAHREYVAGMSHVAKRWAPSVVCLKGRKGIGTGFFISPTTIVTARHFFDQDAPETVFRADGSPLDAKIARSSLPKSEDSPVDVVLLELDRNVDDVDPMRLTVHRELLDEVVVFGFPPIADLPTPHLFVNRGEVSAEGVLDDGQQVIFVTCLLRGGYSGGPVVNRRGQVIGLVSTNRFKGGRDASGNEGLGAAALIPAEWIEDLRDGKI